MNNLSDFEAHKRDEEFDREDAKRTTFRPVGDGSGWAHAPVTHAQRVAFADAMMKAPEPEDVENAPLEACVLCGHAEPTKDLITGKGGVKWHDECARDV